jgi:hypothetical protein
MISIEHKCIFIHQRKCAGCSIMLSFGYGPGDPRRVFMNEGILSPDFESRPHDFTIFSVVRNPWDRFVSAWLYCEGTRSRPLRDVLQSLPQLDHDYIHVTRLQRDILHYPDGYPVAHHLLRFENLQGDWDALSDVIGKPRTVLQHANRSPTERRHYREYFEDPIDRDLFLRHFARDVDTYGYEF